MAICFYQFSSRRLFKQFLKIIILQGSVVTLFRNGDVLFIANFLLNVIVKELKNGTILCSKNPPE